MRKILSLLFFPLLLLAQELEVRLPTRSLKKAIYISQIKLAPEKSDGRYAEELRSVLEFDLTTGGFLQVCPVESSFELNLRNLEEKSGLSFYKQANIFYLLKLEIEQDALFATVFDVQEGKRKKYSQIALTGKIEQDRRHLHKLSDMLHKDLFDVEGIASLKMLYAKRASPHEERRKSEIWISDIDGENPRQLTFENNYCLSPAFFPQSKYSEFLYINFKDGQSKIYRLSQESGKRVGEQMLSLRGSHVLPTISRRGTEIAFISDVAGRPDLFFQKLDSRGEPIGKAHQIFSAPRATQASPTFHPDGKKIAFVSDKDGTPRIYLLNVPEPKSIKKPNPILLTKRNRENTSPAWSPDGTKLAYSARTDGIRQIWLYDFKTEEETQLTAGPEMKENPSWAPDSFHLIYNTESDERCELFLIDIREPSPIQISKGPGQKRFPSL